MLTILNDGHLKWYFGRYSFSRSYANYNSSFYAALLSAYIDNKFSSFRVRVSVEVQSILLFHLQDVRVDVFISCRYHVKQIDITRLPFLPAKRSFKLLLSYVNNTNKIVC